MVMLLIRQFGDLVLKQKSSPVDVISKDIKSMIKNMADTMYAARGLGLAANQIGVLQSIFVMDESSEGKELKAYANPCLLEKSEEVLDEEGCLSLGEIRLPVKRFNKVKVKAIDIQTGREVVIEASGLKARILQHEIDHLNGNLILDRTTKEERKKALKLLSLPKL